MEYFFEGKLIRCRDPKYGTLFDELLNYNIDDLNFAIEDIENVFNGKYKASSLNGAIMSSIDYDKEKAVITYYDELIGEESTQEIYQMLKDYRDAIIYFRDKPR